MFFSHFFSNSTIYTCYDLKLSLIIESGDAAKVDDTGQRKKIKKKLLSPWIYYLFVSLLIVYKAQGKEQDTMKV